MNIRDFLAVPGEKPLDRLVTDGGFCGIFRTLGCIGDSLSSGEFEAVGSHGETTYHDFFDYSWGQYLARMAGCKVYNFSRGGMTAREYLDSFAESMGFWAPKLACQGYLLALGVNDLFNENTAPEVFDQNYRRIIRRYRVISPGCKFFLITMPRGFDTPQGLALKQTHADLLDRIAKEIPCCYVIDLFRHGPEYDRSFRNAFYLGGHMNPMGYVLTARLVASYIDFIIRHHPEDFREVGFIGIFRGTFDDCASDINEEMTMAAAETPADLIPDEALGDKHIIPTAFDPRVHPAVTVVAEATHRTGVARIKQEEDSYEAV